MSMPRVPLKLSKDDIQECPCGSTTFARETSGEFATLERGRICFEDFMPAEVIADTKAIDKWTYRCTGCHREVLPWTV